MLTDVFLSFNLYTEAVPKKILELMDVKDLTRSQVASHLQVLIFPLPYFLKKMCIIYKIILSLCFMKTSYDLVSVTMATATSILTLLLCVAEIQGTTEKRHQ